jgi:hypothetical protein
MKQHTHQIKNGRPEIVSKSVSPQLRGADSWTAATVRTGPLKRLAGAVLNKIGDK